MIRESGVSQEAYEELGKAINGYEKFQGDVSFVNRPDLAKPGGNMWGGDWNPASGIRLNSAQGLVDLTLAAVHEMQHQFEHSGFEPFAYAIEEKVLNGFPAMLKAQAVLSQAIITANKRRYVW